jgi:hypothetical protein
MIRPENIPRPLLIRYRYYQAGVGSMGTLSNKIVQGISGEGLAEHVRTSQSAVIPLRQRLIVLGEAYTFIANNWNPGDEIFLIGFSRGAFTARSIGKREPRLDAAVLRLTFFRSGGVICNIGIMTRAGLPAFQVVYQASRMHDLPYDAASFH